MATIKHVVLPGSIRPKNASAVRVGAADPKEPVWFCRNSAKRPSIAARPTPIRKSRIDTLTFAFGTLFPRSTPPVLTALLQPGFSFSSA